ncbi:MAG TPA: PhzF family phenazine biosynthesis protein [Acidimicrobiia bacterium]|nr:PhzF family phenazine biosynthesis protein [Acidimicrobiia bacterium]
MPRPFHQVDVFTTEPHRGNPVAVVLEADGVDSEAMQRFAHWTNLSETTFVVAPSTPAADYAVRIFTPTEEIPFVGHPTLGTCHAWLEVGGQPRDSDRIVQECTAGLIPLRRSHDRLAFAAPPLLRAGAVSPDVLQRVVAQLGISRTDVVDAAWADNGPGWVAVLLADAEAVLAVRPGSVDLDIGLVGFHPPGSETAIEVRAFFPKDGTAAEDPVTGSLNASVAMWLSETGRLSPPYVASQGACLGRVGRVYIDADPDGTIWVGGCTVTCISGAVEI